jgi:ribose-phosphate pyrophosphokinase
LIEHGAKRIYAGVSHAVLGEKGRQRIADSSIIELFTTDSVPQAFGEKVTALSIASLMSDAIKRIHSNESVTSLFNV